MPRRKRERIGWGHVAASGVGLLLANLLLRLGLRGPGQARPAPPPTPAADDDAWGPRLVDHTPVQPEPRDVRVRPVLISIVAVMVFFGLVTAAVSGLQWLQTGALPSLRPPAGVDDLPQGLAPPDPRLDALPGDTLASVRATEAALLDYGWADEAAGTVRLPIERAMELTAERGLPLAAGAEGRRYDDTLPVWPMDASSGREGERLWP